jgi:hypothetical protein
MAVLKCYDICCNNIVLSINNMINASVATSQLITNANGTCTMHLVNLAGDRTIEKRTLNKENVDSFKESEDVRLVVH